MNDHIKDVTRRFAAAGHHAVAPALFHRAGGGTADYDDFAAVIPLFEGVTDDGILADVDATLEHLHGAGLRRRRRSASSASASVGGSTFLVAARRAIGAAVGFYGGGHRRPRARSRSTPLIGESSTLQTPWLGLFGDEDAVDPGRGRRGAARGAADRPGRDRDRPVPGRASTGSTATRATENYHAGAGC